MRIRVAKIDTDREPKEGRGLVNDGASFILSINTPSNPPLACPFKAKGRRGRAQGRRGWGGLL